jgi:hypothetical protein
LPGMRGLFRLSIDILSFPADLKLTLPDIY